MSDHALLDKTSWRKYLFYVDMVIWGILAVATAYVVGNIYLVGFYEGANDLVTHEAAWWRSFVGLAFLVGSLAWVFLRFWKNGFIALKRPF